MKLKALRDSGESAFGRYRALCYGDTSLGHVLRAELLVAALGSVPGAAGIFLRGTFYRGLFAAAGKNLLIGRNVTFRHVRKIRLGDDVIIDDNAVIDAKGVGNLGIEIGNRVFIGRNTIVYCKNGDIRLDDDVSLSSNCTVFSSNRLRIGRGTMIGAYSYLLSGGEYDYTVNVPFAEQDGMCTKGELTVGADCWLGARVTVLDAACIGDRCVIGAGTVVSKPILPGSLAVGIPARKIKSI